MKTPELTDSLMQLGLTQAEARLYVWLVGHVQSTGYEASKAMRVPRGTAYATLENLVERGLVRSSIQNKKRVYVPASFSVWKKDLEERQRITSELLPALEHIVPIKNHAVDVRVYKGMAGLQKAWDEVIEHFEKKSVKNCYAISHGSQIYAVMPRYFRRWIERRVQNNTKAHLIYPLDDRTAVASGRIAEPLAHYKFAPGSALAFSGDVTCGGNITAIFSFENSKDPHAVIIESEDIAKIMTHWFLTMWHILPEGLPR